MIPSIFLVIKQCVTRGYKHAEHGSCLCGSPLTRIGLLCALIIIANCLYACGDHPGPTDKKVRINAAASIAYVIEGLADAIEQDLDIRIEVNTGASGTLAQQIMQGDKADLFISADPAWMDRLAQANLIDQETRTELVGNRIVVVGLKGSAPRPGSLADLSQEQYQPIAMGDPAYVPAGRYAMQALEAHGLDRGSGIVLAEAPNVRAALTFVRSGQCPVGLVYASDIHNEDSAEVLLSIDPTDYDPIRYPEAMIRDAPNSDGARRVLAWLQSEPARVAFRGAGFIDP